MAIDKRLDYSKNLFMTSRAYALKVIAGNSYR